jgi:protein phosphatase 1B
MGSHLDKPVTEKDSENATLHDGLLFLASAMQGWRVNMEDSHYGGTIKIGNHIASLACVFDGHGGDLVAMEAAKQIKPKLEAMLSGVDSNDPDAIGVVMQAAFLSLDEDLKKLPLIVSGDDQSGCTAIVAIITNTHIIVANSGDARGILMQGDGTVKPMSFDHKPTNPEETARIEAAGGCVSMRRVNGDLAVSRALGDFTYKQTESVPAKDQMVSAFPDIEIAERDGKEQFLLLCCDGIWDVMSNADAGAFVKEKIEGKYKGEPISKVSERLLDKCLEKGSRDNMSAVVVLNPKAITPGEDEKPPEVIFAEEQRAKEEYGRDTKTRRV